MTTEANCPNGAECQDHPQGHYGRPVDLNDHAKPLVNPPARLIEAMWTAAYPSETDPNRWHCNHCGHIGPTRHEGDAYRCPKCGQLTRLPDTKNHEQTGQETQGPGAGLGSVPRAQDGLAALLAAEMEALKAHDANVDASDVNHEATQQAYWAARDALDAEMKRRREEVPADPLMGLIVQYGDMRAEAVGESEVGSNVESDRIEARAELVRDEIAATIRATVIAAGDAGYEAGYDRCESLDRAFDAAMTRLEDRNHALRQERFTVRQQSKAIRRLRAESERPVADAEETAAAAAQRFARELSRLTEGLARRGIEPAPETPAGEAPVTTALAALTKAHEHLDCTTNALAYLLLAVNKLNPDDPKSLRVLRTRARDVREVLDDMGLSHLYQPTKPDAAQSTSERDA